MKRIAPHHNQNRKYLHKKAPQLPITKGIRFGYALHFVKLPYRATSDTLVPLYEMPESIVSEKDILNE